MAVQIVPVDGRVTRDVRFRDISQVSGPGVCMLYLPIRANARSQCWCSPVKAVQAYLSADHACSKSSLSEEPLSRVGNLGEHFWSLKRIQDEEQFSGSFGFPVADFNALPKPFFFPIRVTEYECKISETGRMPLRHRAIYHCNCVCKTLLLDCLSPSELEAHSHTEHGARR